MRRALGALGAVIVSVAAGLGSSAGCSAPKPRPAEPIPAPSPAPAHAAAMASLEEAEPALVALEDRRSFDGRTLEAAASSPEAAVRARAALAAGRIGDERAGGHALAPADGRLSGSRGSRRRLPRASSEIPRLTAKLVPLLGDTDDRVAGRAAWSLGFLEQPEGQKALLEALPGRRGRPAVRLSSSPSGATRRRRSPPPSRPTPSDPDPADAHRRALRARPAAAGVVAGRH